MDNNYVEHFENDNNIELFENQFNSFKKEIDRIKLILD